MRWGSNFNLIDIVESIVTETLQWPHRIVVPLGGIPVDTSELMLKPQGVLSVTIVKANDLKNKELIGKSDPYVVLFIRSRLKRKTKVMQDNLNPVWNETFELITEDKETQSLILEVFDKDIGEDKRLGIAKLSLADLEGESVKEIEMSLLPALDMTRVKDKKDRGTITIKVMYQALNKEEQDAAMEEEERELEEKKKLKEEGAIGSTMDALDNAAGVMSAGIGAVGSSLTKAGKFMGRTITRH